ncbi:hypothetical protein ACFPPD_25215 [Cohnella suwonensis]|uniref:Uncharacterized protein n=1 Tax=Cohnella suwonensis TaxID=696072 RepID=A0ABW0M2G2_9BACL
MNRKLPFELNKVTLPIVLLLLILFPSQAAAYSYGDANTEDVAETFKLVESSLSGSSPNWKAAEDAYKARRSEIQSHFGSKVALTLDQNFKDKDGKLVVSNFKAVLVMNLDRRFDYAIKQVSDYSAAKLLLAKAKATYDTLAPYIGTGTKEAEQAFEDALDALGNPGLFGVGKKDADPELFKEKVSYIYSSVKPLFPYLAYEAPAPSKEVPPSKQPEPSEKPVASPSPKPSEEPEVPAAEASATVSPEPSASESPSASASQTAQTEPSNEAEQPPESPETAEEAAPTATIEAQAEHAPMAQTDKTNPWVTFAVIGGVAVLGAAGVWFARKKGLF